MRLRSAAVMLRYIGLLSRDAFKLLPYSNFRCSRYVTKFSFRSLPSPTFHRHGDVPWQFGSR